jgi:hypothetical protein
MSNPFVKAMVVLSVLGLAAIALTHVVAPDVPLLAPPKAVPAAAAAPVSVTPLQLFHEKFQIAEMFEAAAYAAEKCPGLHMIDEGVKATTADLGYGSDDDIIYSTEFKFWVERGQMNAKIGYEKDPAGWCASMWKFLGPDHPPMIKHTLLSKKTN